MLIGQNESISSSGSSAVNISGCLPFFPFAFGALLKVERRVKVNEIDRFVMDVTAQDF